MRAGLSILLAFLLFFGCSQKKKSEKNELVIFCASSLTDVVSEIATGFEGDYQIKVKMNLASSGTLARQIEHGATPAIFISANKKWVDYLNNLKLIIPASEKKVVGNSLVLVAPLESSIDSFAFSPEINLPEIFEGRLSIGDSQHVPAGQYAVQMFEKMKCKEKLEPRFLPAKDVRSALMVVELGEVEAGIVYKTDALKSVKVKIVPEFPDSLHDPLCYYMSVISGQNNENTKKLYNYISSEKAIYIWKKYGFIL